MATHLLRQAAVEPTQPPPGLRPLPEQVVALLVEAGAPSRLAAHLRAVYDVTCHLVDRLQARWPQLRFDTDAVRFGAATHDIGKALHPHELSGPGVAHEPAGYALLIAHGVPDHHARFARTHALWNDADATVEDLLVALADKIWKAQRQHDLEQLLVDHIAAHTEREPWEIFIELDDDLTAIADDAPSRLDFQATYPTL